MVRWTILLAVIAVAALVAIGCAGDDGKNPLTPSSNHELTSESNSTGPTHTQLWGYYDVFVDTENETVEVIPNRQVMYALNVVRFINELPSNLNIKVLDVVPGHNYVDIDIDVTIKHPFLGLPQFNGYDVRGVFIGDACRTLDYNSSLAYPRFNTEQYMLDDPVNNDGGGPDGYTRWYNPTEFITEGMFGYTPGVFQSQDFDGDATLCPYRYFADGLAAHEDAWEFLTSTGKHGVFSVYARNTRNYYIRFPDTIGVQFGYAIVADWEGPDVHPSNAAEAVVCRVIDNSNVHYPDTGGDYGNLILDISLFGWEHQPSTIYIESTVLSAVASFDPALIYTGGGLYYSTYHIEIPADNIKLVECNEYWVIAEYEDDDYSNIIGVPNEAESDYLSALFRYDLNVEITGEFGWARTWLNTSHTIGAGIDTDPEGNVYITGGFNDPVDFNPCGGDPHTETGYHDAFLLKMNPYGHLEWVRTWGGPGTEGGASVKLDGSGNIFVGGYFRGTAYLDPDGGDPYIPVGAIDSHLSKFDPSGNLIWVRTWGGPKDDFFEDMDVDSSGNVSITGYFKDTIDFDPDGGDPHTSNGIDDAFVTRFDSDGNFLWAHTWGASDYDNAHGVAAHDSGVTFVTGGFHDTVEFNPDGGDIYTSNGNYDVYLCRFDDAGSLDWVLTWGGLYCDTGKDVTTDNTDLLIVTGSFTDSVDFNPDGGDQRTSNGGGDVFVSKFDISGNYYWVRTWGGEYSEGTWRFEVDDTGNIFSVGNYILSCDFDPDGGCVRSSNGDYDCFLHKLDSSGNFEWVRTWGGAGEDHCFGVATDVNGNVFASGSIDYGSVEFAPTGSPCFDVPDVHNVDAWDIFLTKHLPDGCW